MTPDDEKRLQEIERRAKDVGRCGGDVLTDYALIDIPWLIALVRKQDIALGIIELGLKRQVEGGES